VLIIGAGAAGLRAALAADAAGAEVMILGKRLKKDAHTVLAAGGINAALGTVDPADCWERHFADTLREGYGMSDPRVVEILAREAPARVEELAAWGCPFARLENGQLDQRYFGAHTYRRTCYAGDWTGRAILHTLVDQVEKQNIQILENQYIYSLLTEQNQCFGALGFDLQSGQLTLYYADAVILAAGGHTRLWRRSSSRRDENGGDSYALALRAGAEVADLEFVQFHPTGMVHPEEWEGTLVTEAVRGEGGRLFNAQGERFMKRYDPERMELSTRDRVALANYTEIMEGRGGPHGGVFLDVSHIGKETILKKLPRMYRQFLDIQMLDIAKDPMEVAPTAHYSMGGIVVNPETHATSVQALFAVGEAATGVHGANRLGGNSLAETVVFGKRVGEAAALYSRTLDKQLRSPEQVEKTIQVLQSHIQEGSEYARPLQRALRETLWVCCGVIRNGKGLEEGLQRVEEIKKAATHLDVRPSSEGFQDLAHACDLQSSLLAAKVTLLGALARKESRGAHQRSDYPHSDRAMDSHFVFHLDQGQLVFTSTPAQTIPPNLQDLEIQKRLLE